jgi:ABC-type glycerol-3-phosphate transport system substrate-binding protein
MGWNFAYAQEKTVLRVWKFGSPQHEREYMVAKNALFQEQNPDIEIEWSYQNWRERRTKVLASNKADNLPDILLSDAISIPEFVRFGIIVPLDEIDKTLVESWKPRFVPECWETGVYEGKVYGVSPFVDTSPILAYNTRMFKEAGIVDEDGNARPPKDWDEMLQIAKDLTKDGVYGIGIPGSNSLLDLQIFTGVAYRNGGRWVEGNEVVINGPGFVDALAFYKELTKYAAPGFTETNFRQTMEIFFQEKTAMALTQSFAPILRQSLGAPDDFPYSIAPVPLRSSKSGAYDIASFIMTPTVCHLITRQGNQEAAMRYIDFWMSQDAQEGWSGSVIEGRIPMLTANLESADFARVYPDLAKAYQAGTLFQGALSMPAFPGLSEAEEKLVFAFQEVLLGVKKPQKALDDMQKEIQKIYDKANK